MICTQCPRNCKAERGADRPGGVCAMPEMPVVARAALHAWEEPPISGTRGSGAVFFSGCPLRCVFCQNSVISQEGFGRAVTVERLRAIFEELIAQGAHNINLVTPTHFAHAILPALEKPLPVPVVWNTGGYESMETLRILEGKVQVYLPDLKYLDPERARRYSAAPDYPAAAAAAVGFDEVQFDYIRFSTDVKADEVDYGPEAETVGKIDIITEFTQYIYEKLRPLGVYVAADVFGTVIENETDQQIVGQDYVKMAEYLDYICPMIYPSHYRNGSYGIAVPDADPYHTIYGACSASVQELEALPEENRAHVRAWLQSFTASWVPGHISYGPQQIRAQIKGAYDAGYDEWILWNAAVKYQRDSLLTDEEAEAERQQWETEKETKKQEAAAEETAGEQGEATQEETAGQQGEATQEETAGQQEQVPQEETPQDKTAGTVPEGIAGQPTDTDPDASTGQ